MPWGFRVGIYQRRSYVRFEFNLSRGHVILSRRVIPADKISRSSILFSFVLVAIVCDYVGSQGE